MKITALYVYPIKALRGIPLQTAQLGPQGVRYDRRFMLFQLDAESGALKHKMQLSRFPQCALFSQELHLGSDDGDAIIRVRYHPPPSGDAPGTSSDADVLEVPLEPDTSGLTPVEVSLYGSGATAYGMGASYDAWFSARFGFPVAFLYIGDGKRPVLGSLSPRAKRIDTGGSWLSLSLTSVMSYLWGSSASEEADWLAFSDVAPFLVTSEASVRDVQARILAGADDEEGDGASAEASSLMYKFRPNIVVDGEAAWAEDFWTGLAIWRRGTAAGREAPPRARLALTGNCGRCASVNVDYRTGRPAAGELGTVLKKMMRDRRVDPGYKYSPVFGRYGFLVGGEGAAQTGVEVAVGDEVDVTARAAERSVFDWPGLATL